MAEGLVEPRRRRFIQVDVFTKIPYLGNALAVVIDSDNLSVEQMQRFARWTNLSETTFLLPPVHPDADYKVRIFTPTKELPFAGHPTLGSCFAFLQSGKTPNNSDFIVQECGVGLVRIKSRNGTLAFASPPLIKGGPVDDSLVAKIANILEIDKSEIIDSQWADNGPGWIAVMLRDAAAVISLKAPPKSDVSLGVVGFYPKTEPPNFLYEVRAFFPENGIVVEDPVTGSLNASIAQWLRKSGKIPQEYIASQGPQSVNVFINSSSIFCFLRNCNRSRRKDLHFVEAGDGGNLGGW